MSKLTDRPIRKVAVVGAGTMGAAIAQHFLVKGLCVVLLDASQAGLEQGCANLDASLDEAVSRRILTEQQKQMLYESFSGTTSYRNLQQCDLVVEAVFEDFNVKQAVFREIESVVSDDCIIASNTSSFSITELGAAIDHRGRFIGVHYFYHAAKNKLVEVVPGKESDPQQVTRLVDFYYACDKAPILVADSHGFAVNRFFVPWLIEATRLLEEGKGSIAFIDKIALKYFKIGMGPFALMNATGVPIALHSAETLEDAFGPMYGPPDILRAQVEVGEDWDCSSQVCLNGGRNSETEVKSRLLGMTLGIAAQMVGEEVCTATNADLGARIGLRWPVGPFELMNSLGMSKMEEVITLAFTRWNQPLPIAFDLKVEAQGFSVEHVKAHISGSTGVIELNRPDAMNALNEIVVAQLAGCFGGLDANPELEKIIFFGRGKAFVAGADIKFFIDNIKNDDLGRIYHFTVAGQKLLSRIAASAKKTIALLDGITLGGGLELALACDHRIATKKLAAAFPETAIGIYPGLGGTQRAPRLIGKGLSKYLIATGDVVNAEKALCYGLVDTIIESVSRIEKIATLDVVHRERDIQTLPEEVFADFDGDATNPAFERYRDRLQSKAPLALKRSMQLIDQGAELSLTAALQLELDGLYEIFLTQDAFEGLSSVINNTRSRFTGK